MIYFLSALRHTKFPSQAPAPMDRSMGDDARLRQSNCASRAGLITPPRLAPRHRPYENRSGAGRIFPEINWLGLRDRRERQATIHGVFAPFGTGEKHPRDLRPRADEAPDPAMLHGYGQGSHHASQDSSFAPVVAEALTCDRRQVARGKPS